MTNRKISACLALLMMLMALTPAFATIESDTYCPSGRNDYRHTFSEVSREGGCAQGRYIVTYRCRWCRYEKVETESAPHSWGAWIITEEATCSSTGQRARTCRVCGTNETQTVPKTAHAWGEWVVTDEPTDHSAGQRAHTCARCGETETEPFDPEGTLRRGDTGDDVTALQQALACNGELTTGSADGKFGPGTEAAVRSFQEREGLTVDGVAWPETIARLSHPFGEWEIISEKTDFSIGLRRRVCARCGLVEEEEDAPSPIYRRGDKGDEIVALQQALNEAGYPCGEPDGEFGARTEQAVADLEKDNGAQPDGIAWPGVLKLLHILPADVAAGPAASTGLTLTAEPIPAAHYSEGDTVEAVFTLRNLSTDSAYIINEIVVSGKAEFDDEAWMHEPLAPGGAEQFTARVSVTTDDIDTEWGYVRATVSAVEEVSGAPRYVSDIAFYAVQVEGPSLLLIPYDTTGMTAAQGEVTPVKLCLINNGTVDIDHLALSVSGSGGATGVEDYCDIAPEPTDVLASCESVTFTDFVVPGADDAVAAQANGGLFDRAVLIEGQTVTDAQPVHAQAEFALALLTAPAEPAVSPEKPDDGPAITAIKEADTTGSPFGKGDVIHYTIILYNNTDEPINEIEVYDPLKGTNEDMMVDLIMELLPHGSVALSFDHTVTEDDLTSDHLDNQAFYIYTDAAGDQVTEYTNTVSVALDAGSEPTVTGPSLMLTKEVVSRAEDQGETPEDDVYRPDETVTYLITVKNVGDAPAMDVVISDPMIPEDAVPGPIDVLEPDGEYLFTYSYTVKAGDADPLVNEASVTYTDEHGAPGQIGPVFCEVHVASDEPTLEIVKSVDGDPADEAGYALDEVVHYTLLIHSLCDETIADIDIFDPMFSETEPLNHIDELAPDQAVLVAYDHTVTGDDVDAGSIKNTAYVAFVSGEDELRVDSNEVVVPTKRDPVTVLKSVANHPAEGELFMPDEIIEFAIEVTNHTDDRVITADVIDFPNGSMTGELVTTLKDIQPHDTLTVYYYYHVRPEDAGTEVTNQALIGWKDDAGNGGTVWSNVATAQVGKPVIIVPPETPQPAAEKADLCVPTLTGAADGAASFALSLCTTHAAVAVQAQALTEDDTPEGWAQARLMWQTELGNAYTAWADRVDPAEKTYVSSERAAFFIQLYCAGQALAAADPDDPTIADRFACEQMKIRLAYLCYESHTAPEARSDMRQRAVPIDTGAAPDACVREYSGTVERTVCRESLCALHRETDAAVSALVRDAATDDARVEAWVGARDMWLKTLSDALDAWPDGGAGASALTAFTQWLAARERQLKWLYPDQPALAAEIAAQTVRGRVLDLCLGR